MPRTVPGWGTDDNAYICSKRRAGEGGGARFSGGVPTAIKINKKIEHAVMQSVWSSPLRKDRADKSICAG